MNIGAMLKDTFSAHELAVLAGPPPAILMACCIFMTRLGHPMLALLLFVFACIWCVSFVALSRCPSCGKSPWKYQVFGTYRFPFRLPPRLWPEHECSACGTSLDGF